MSEASYDGNDEDWDWWNWENGGGGAAPTGDGGITTTGASGPPGGGMPTSGYGGSGGDGTYTPPSGGIDYWSNPFPGTGTIHTGGGNPTPGTGIETGGGNPPTGPTGSNSVNNNTQNNTQNNSNVLAQSVGLGAVSPISSGVPQSPASSFRPNVISPGGGLHEGAPPPMPTPHAQVPPSLHPEMPTDWSKITFGAASSAPQSNPAGQRSTLGKIGGAIGQVTGISQAAQRYKGLYDSMHPPKPKTPEEEQAEAYRATYGL